MWVMEAGLFSDVVVLDNCGGALDGGRARGGAVWSEGFDVSISSPMTF